MEAFTRPSYWRRNGYQNHDKYDDVLQAFIVESLSTTTTNTSNVKDIWHLHTGATNHLTNIRDWLYNYKEVEPPIIVRFGNNGTKPTIGKGDITFEVIGGRHFTIKEVLYVLGITKHLLSVSQATTKGSIIEFHSNHAIIKHKAIKWRKAMEEEMKALIRNGMLSLQKIVI